MKMKNYEKYLDGILLITWSPSYIGSASLTVTHLFVLICGVTGVAGGLVSSCPSLHDSAIQGFVFFTAGVSSEGLGARRIFISFFKL